MKKGLKIIQVTDKNDDILDVASKWIYEWYGKESGRTLREVQEYYRHCACTDRLPQTFIAYKDSIPIGTFQFGMSDNFVRPDIYPWLKNVYIDHSHRGNGYADIMLDAAVESAKKAGLKELYLFTHITGLYERHGWKLLEEFETYNEGYGRQKLYVLKFN